MAIALFRSLKLMEPEFETGLLLFSVTAGLVAAVGAGIYGSLEEAVAQMVTKGEIYQPRAEFVDRYEALYQVYLGLYPALKASFKQLAAVNV